LTAIWKKNSCEAVITLLALAEEWRLALDSKENVAVLSTDMSKGV